MHFIALILGVISLLIKKKILIANVSLNFLCGNILRSSEIMCAAFVHSLRSLTMQSHFEFLIKGHTDSRVLVCEYKAGVVATCSQESSFFPIY